MVKLVEALLHPYRVPGIGKVLSKIDPLSAKLDKTVSNSLDYDYRPNKDDLSAFKRGGKVRKFSKGGSMDDLTPRGNLPDKNAAEQAKEAKRRKPKKEDDLTLYENLPPKKFAKGGSVRGDGCCAKGKTKGRFR